MRHRFFAAFGISAVVTAALLAPAFSQTVQPPVPDPAAPPPPAFTNEILKKEPGIGHLPTGASVLIDDGTCPKGQIKKVVGGSVATGQPRVRSCIPKP